MLCGTLYFVYEGDPARIIDSLSTVQIIGWRFDGKMVMNDRVGLSRRLLDSNISDFQQRKMRVYSNVWE